MSRWLDRLFHGEGRMGLLLLSLTAASGLFLLGRMLYTGRFGYLFLAWNLFLAWRPYGFSRLFVYARARSKWPAYAAGAAWLLFYPNAPYMITDFIHISHFEFYGAVGADGRVFRSDLGMWYIFFLIAMFVMTGLAAGSLSLAAMHRHVRARHGGRAGWLFVGGVSVLSGFAIYLGRFVRLNSWELITHPLELLRTVGDSLGVQAAAFTLLFGALTLTGYLLFYAANRRAPDKAAAAD